MLKVTSGQIKDYSSQYPIRIFKCKKVKSVRTKLMKKEDTSLMKELFP